MRVRFTRAYNAITRYVLGDDVFISYSRRDGRNYALALATALAGCRCYVDQFGTEPSKAVPAVVHRRLLRSTVLVVIASDEATQSEPVQDELRRFIRTGRAIVPITFGNAIDNTPLGTVLVGLPVTVEAIESLHSAVPTSMSVSRVQGSLAYTRHSVRMKRLIVGAILTVSMLIFATVGYQLNAKIIAKKNEAIAKKDEDCRLARERVQSHNENLEYAQTWPVGWESELKELEAEVESVCGEK